MKVFLDTEADIIALKAQQGLEFKVGDIIVHKGFLYHKIYGLLRIHFPDISIFPASPGTPVYTLNGYNTSVVSESIVLEINTINGGNAFSTFTDTINGGDAFSTFTDTINGGNSTNF